MNRAGLIEKISLMTGVSKAATNRALTAILETITLSLKKNEPVSLVGFGSFIVRKRSARQAINPKTKQIIQIKSAKVPAFRAGKRLKKDIN